MCPEQEQENHVKVLSSCGSGGALQIWEHGNLLTYLLKTFNRKSALQTGSM